MNNAFDEPTVVWHTPDTTDRPLVVLLHGRGADETGIIGLAGHLPAGPSYAAVRAPIPAGGGYAWFANRGIGRPVAESLNQTMAWFRKWLDNVAPPGRQVILVGFSGGAAFAGGLLLSDPQRFAGAAILNGTLPFDAGVPTSPARLAGVPVFVAQGETDTVIPRELLDRTWTYLLGDSGAPSYARRDPGLAATASPMTLLRSLAAGSRSVCTSSPPAALCRPTMAPGTPFPTARSRFVPALAPMFPGRYRRSSAPTIARATSGSGSWTVSSPCPG
ncbi:serine esterase [Arthrobacter sp. DNA4]|uniref:alpha/beta hydrolase n=1 Tax=Arthrobacter sp. DNA4 TaxID=2963432 RepID=UPI0020CD3117|nr:serine esterase [Arthrobacter sp. DNA4]UTT71210.1 serine esterase [Arthrobacter sp. DNA4]